MIESSVTDGDRKDDLETAIEDTGDALESAADDVAETTKDAVDEAADEASDAVENVGEQVDAEIEDMTESRSSDDSAQPHDDAAGHEDGSSQGSNFASIALKLLIGFIVLFGLAIWLVPQVAPMLPASAHKYLMPGQQAFETRLASVEAQMSEGAGVAAGDIDKLAAQISDLQARLEAAEKAAAAARQEAADAQTAAAESAKAASASTASESVVAEAKTAATEAASAAETATTAATEAGKVAATATRDAAALSRQLTSFETRLNGVSDELGALSESLANAPAGSSNGTATPELTAAFSALKARVDGLGKRLESNAEFMTQQDAERFATQDDLRSARTALSADLKAEIDRLPDPATIVTAKDLDSFRTAVDGKIGDLTSRVETAEQGAAKAAESAASASEASNSAVGEVKTAIRDASLRSAVAALTSRLQNGVGFSGPLAEIEQITGIAPPEALGAVASTGAATTESLLRNFGRNAQNAMAADIRENSDDGLLGQAGAQLRSVVAGRPKSEQEGDDTGAVLSRIEARLKDGKVGEAAAEAAKLPETAKNSMADWLKLLNARAAAEAAAATYVSDISKIEG